MCNLSIHMLLEWQLFFIRCILSLEQKDVIKSFCLSVCANGCRLQISFFGQTFAGKPKKTLIQLLILYMNFNALLVGVTCARSTPRYNHSIWYIITFLEKKKSSNDYLNYLYAKEVKYLSVCMFVCSLTPQAG